jgi:glyoxylase-like metal-dependent hydrolase (beta-lactamase superfamily II)/rhodanese-related sulfurtransferase
VVFESVRTEQGCVSYLIGCERSSAAIVVDPDLSQVDRYLALAARHGVRIRYLLDTHTHADHFSGVRPLAARLDALTVMHRLSAAPFVDLRVEDGETLLVGELRLHVIHTPGHTSDSICLLARDRLLTGDTLLLGATGRTDLPSGDPEALHESLFGRILRLDGALQIHPAHNYKNLPPTTLDVQRATNPRLQQPERAAFVEQMRRLSLEMPRHLTEALRTNQSGGRTVAQIIDEAARQVPFMTMEELRRRIESGTPGVAILDVREADAYAAGHVPGAIHLPRGQLELRADAAFPDPTVRIVTYCEFGKISTIAAATLRSMGFRGAIALDGGIRAWREAGHPIEPAGSARGES